MTKCTNALIAYALMRASTTHALLSWILEPG